jgi:hypothetical protein
MGRVIVEVQGGMVQSVYADDPTTEVVLVDWDTEGCDPEREGLVSVEGDLVTAVVFSTTPTQDMPPETTEAVRRAT